MSAGTAEGRAEARAALAAHVDTIARIRDALGRDDPEVELLVGLLEGVGSATGWGRRPVDDIDGALLADYRRVLRGPT